MAPLGQPQGSGLAYATPSSAPAAQKPQKAQGRLLEGGLKRALATLNRQEEMTTTEILTGKGDYFPGLLPLIYAYLEAIGCDPETGAKVGEYLELIRLRAAGWVDT